ncbi:hypothetical protein Hdeb2414_s0010g00346351 [Helianthus debilis subsp. tardiflorus]
MRLKAMAAEPIPAARLRFCRKPSRRWWWRLHKLEQWQRPPQRLDPTLAE